VIGNLFAAGMIAMLVPPAIALKGWGANPTLRDILTGIIFAMPSFLGLVVLTPVHGCLRGGTLSPELAAAALAGLVLAVVPPRKVKIPVIALLLLGGFSLTYWAMDLVHAAPYVGNPRWPAQLDNISSTHLDLAHARLRELSADYADVVLPEGWIEESWRAATGQEFLRHAPGYISGTVGHFWHTWFTGIYHLEERRNGIWCPGGPLSACVDRLELRDR